MKLMLCIFVLLLFIGCGQRSPVDSTMKKKGEAREIPDSLVIQDTTIEEPR